MAGKIIAFPLPATRTCYDCQHVFLGSTGSWCGQYEERIWMESIAEECSEFHPFEEPMEGVSASEDED